MRTLSKNLPYLQQQFCALLGNTSAPVKVMSVVVLFGYFLSFSQEAVNVLSVRPGYIFPPAFWIWTAFTFCFLELHFWEVCVDIVTVGLCGKLIEPLWSSMEVVTFFGIVNLGVAAISASFYLFLYMCSSDTMLLFDIHIHGMSGYIAGVAVAVKQIMPDHILLKTPLGKMTNRNVPLNVFLASLVLWLVGVLEGTYPTMFASGVLVSWTYLRFYQWHSNGTKGDMADNFTFASFFPTVLQPPIAVFSNTVHSFLVRIRLCRRTVRKFDMAAAPTGVTVTLPGIDPHDMERRRLIALKALNERLGKTDSSVSSLVGIPRPSQKDRSKIATSPIPTSTSSSGSVVSIPIPTSVESHSLAPPFTSPSVPPVQSAIVDVSGGTSNPASS